MEKDYEGPNMLEQDSIISPNQSDAFAKHLGMFIEPVGAHLIERTKALSEWVRQRTELSTWPYARARDQAPRLSSKVRMELLSKASTSARKIISAFHSTTQYAMLL
jgi:hypothetical protein